MMVRAPVKFFRSPVRHVVMVINYSIIIILLYSIRIELKLVGRDQRKVLELYFSLRARGAYLSLAHFYPITAWI